MTYQEYAKKIWTCPRCKRKIDKEYPALSRRDNKTYICSQCGRNEAMEDYMERNNTQTYRITWRHEVYIKAKNPEELKEKWEGLDLQNLKESGFTNDYVEIVSIEDEEYNEARWD